MMDTESSKKAKNILSVHMQFYKLHGDVFSKKTENTVLHNLEKLDAVSTRLKSFNDRQDFDNIDGKEILSKLYETFQRKQDSRTVLLKRSSLRLCSYSITGGEWPFLKYVLEVFDYNWSSAYVHGLLHSLLKNWDSFEIDEIRLLNSYLLNKIPDSNSNLKNALGYISESGPYKLGNLLLSKNKSIFSSVEIFNLPRNRFSYSYFNDCVVGYYENKDIVDIDELREVLIEHNHISVCKIVIPDIIIRYDSKKRNIESLARFAIDEIGDPYIKSMWGPFSGMTPIQAQKLEKARKILVAYLTRNVVSQFFKNLTDDENRLIYWLSKINLIEDFRVYGPRSARYAVSSVIDSDVVNSHFITITGNVVKETCALMMFIKEYVIIEFTDVGALYVYHSGTPLYAQITGYRTIQRIDELKTPEMVTLIDKYRDSYIYHDQGRMVHIGHWQQRLNSWFKRKVL